jgi:hypothetical protein
LFSDFNLYIADFLCAVSGHAHRFQTISDGHRFISKAMELTDAPSGRSDATPQQPPFSGVFNRNPAEVAKALPRPRHPSRPVPPEWKPPMRAVPSVADRMIVGGVAAAAAVSNRLQRQSRACRLVAVC